MVSGRVEVDSSESENQSASSYDEYMQEYSYDSEESDDSASLEMNLKPLLLAKKKQHQQGFMYVFDFPGFPQNWKQHQMGLVCFNLPGCFPRIYFPWVFPKWDSGIPGVTTLQCATFSVHAKWTQVRPAQAKGGDDTWAKEVFGWQRMGPRAASQSRSGINCPQRVFMGFHYWVIQQRLGTHPIPPLPWGMVNFFEKMHPVFLQSDCSGAEGAFYGLLSIQPTKSFLMSSHLGLKRLYDPVKRFMTLSWNPGRCDRAVGPLKFIIKNLSPRRTLCLNITGQRFEILYLFAALNWHSMPSEHKQGSSPQWRKGTLAQLPNTKTPMHVASAASRSLLTFRAHCASVVWVWNGPV